MPQQLDVKKWQISMKAHELALQQLELITPDTPIEDRERLSELSKSFCEIAEHCEKRCKDLDRVSKLLEESDKRESGYGSLHS